MKRRSDSIKVKRWKKILHGTQCFMKWIRRHRHCPNAVCSTFGAYKIVREMSALVLCVFWNADTFCTLLLLVQSFLWTLASIKISTAPSPALSPVANMRFDSALFALIYAKFVLLKLSSDKMKKMKRKKNCRQYGCSVHTVLGLLSYRHEYATHTVSVRCVRVWFVYIITHA